MRYCLSSISSRSSSSSAFAFALPHAEMRQIGDGGFECGFLRRGRRGREGKEGELGYRGGARGVGRVRVEVEVDDVGGGGRFEVEERGDVGLEFLVGWRAHPGGM